MRAPKAKGTLFSENGVSSSSKQKSQWKREEQDDESVWTLTYERPTKKTVEISQYMYESRSLELKLIGRLSLENSKLPDPPKLKEYLEELIPCH